jgi:hypothetical protein
VTGLGRQPGPLSDPGDSARLELLRRLSDAGYQFTTPAPATYRRVLLRRGRVKAKNLADVFGWSLPFAPELLDGELLRLMDEGEMLIRRGPQLASRFRVASLEGLLFLHSAYPTKQAHSVFFGPDSYRFVHFIRSEMPDLRPGSHLLDIGAGSGVGGIFAETLAPESRVVLADVNTEALRLARVNAAFARVAAELREGDGLDGDGDGFELIVANPPYVGGTSGPVYRAGGGDMGAEVSLRWARAAMSKLAPGGRLLLYTGSAIVRGSDPLRVALAQAADSGGCTFSYRELDPDVFPGLLARPSYWAAERIAAVGATFERTDAGRGAA